MFCHTIVLRRIIGFGEGCEDEWKVGRSRLETVGQEEQRGRRSTSF